MSFFNCVKIKIVYCTIIFGVVGCTTTGGKLKSVDLSHYEMKVKYKPSACIQYAPEKKHTLFRKQEKIKLRAELQGSTEINQALLDVAKEFNGFSDLWFAESCDSEKSDLLIYLTPYLVSKILPSANHSDVSFSGFMGGLGGAILAGIIAPYYIASIMSLGLIPIPVMAYDLHYIMDVEVLDCRNGISQHYAFEEEIESVFVWLPLVLWQEQKKEELKALMWKKMAENLYAAMFVDKFFEKPENQLEIPQNIFDIE